jgi:hypothetical protein
MVQCIMLADVQDSEVSASFHLLSVQESEMHKFCIEKMGPAERQLDRELHGGFQTPQTRCLRYMYQDAECLLKY